MNIFAKIGIVLLSSASLTLGRVALYANHFYWLYKLYPDGIAGRLFPQFWPI